MTRLWRPGGETVLDAVHAVQQKPQQGQQQNSNDDHDTRPSRLTAPPRVPTTSTASQRDTRRPGKRGGRESKTGDRPNVPRPDDTARHRQGRTLRPPQVSWPFPVRLRTTTRPPRAHAHANATSPRPSADGSTGQAASAPARSPPRSSRRVLKPLYPLRHVRDGTGAHRFVAGLPDGRRHAIGTPGGMTLGKSHEKRLPHSPTSTQRCHPEVVTARFSHRRSSDR